jgi:hypothetical protein
VTDIVGFIPAAPLLVEDLAGDTRERTRDLRVACHSVVTELLATQHVTVLAAASPAGSWEASAIWDFGGFGVARRHPPGGEVLPWQLGVGAWWLDRVGFLGTRTYRSVENTGTPAPPPAGGILVVGDGSARRSEQAPGYLDPRAKDFDTEVAAALATGDVAGLAGLDPQRASELMCAGAPAWRVLGDWLVDRTVVSSDLRLDTAEFGVGYVAAVWQLS